MVSSMKFGYVSLAMLDYKVFKTSILEECLLGADGSVCLQDLNIN